jgi:hypothetical protein
MALGGDGTVAESLYIPLRGVWRADVQENRSDALLMAAMMAMCVGVFLLFVLVPALGLAPGIAVAVAAGAAMVYAHWKLMGPRHGH